MGYLLTAMCFFVSYTSKNNPKGLGVKRGLGRHDEGTDGAG